MAQTRVSAEDVSLPGRRELAVLICNMQQDLEGLRHRNNKRPAVTLPVVPRPNEVKEFNNTSSMSL